jgi:hypothetical protein
MAGRGPPGAPPGLLTLQAALRQLNDHLVAVLDAPIAYPPRRQRETPTRCRPVKPSAHPPAVDRAADGMLSLGAPHLAWIEPDAITARAPGPAATMARNR